VLIGAGSPGGRHDIEDRIAREAILLYPVVAGDGALGFNDTWQLVINTSTTIVTFLMVFIIQNSQNRDTAAMQIKLDELIDKVEGAREELLDLEELDEDKLEEMRAEFEELARKARAAREGRSG
jgi:low affinity Fe/Cu permease